MKKRISIFLTVLTILCSTIGLTSCNLSWGGDGGEVVTTLTQLPEPNITEVKDNYVYWEEVPNASSYLVKINGYQESASNQLKYSISSIMDSRVEYNIPTELHIYVKAKGNQILYSDSEWSTEYTYTYTKIGSSSSKKSVDVPKFEKYDSANNILSWSEVEGPVIGYELDINGVVKTTSLRVFSPDVKQNERFSVKIRAIVPENDNQYMSSPWSSVTELKYMPIDNSAEKYAKEIAKARELRIGYGYNFIDDVYFDNNNSSVNSILDLEKLFSYAYFDVNGQAAGNLVAERIYEKSVENFSSSIRSKINNEISLEGSYGFYSANISASLNIQDKIDFGSYSESGFLNCYTYSPYKNYQVQEFGTIETLSNYLSDNFLAVVNRTGNLSNLSDAELAKYIVDYYGTHLIVGIITGGRLDYYYCYATNNSKFAQQFELDFNSQASAGVSNLVSASAKKEFGFSSDISIDSNEVKQSSKFNIYGGSSDGITESNVEEKYTSWASSINDSNARSVAVSKGGALSISSLIRYINPQLADAIDNEISNRSADVYNKLINSFKNSGTYYEEGTEGNPIELNNENFNSIRNGLDKHYILTENIDLSQYDNWIPIGCDGAGTGADYVDFTGSLDGNFYSIRGLKADKPSAISDKHSWKGLFARLNSGAVVENLFIDCSFTYLHTDQENGDYYQNVGVAAGEAIDATIKNVATSGKISIGETGNYLTGRYYVGGIVGNANGNTRISCCSSSVEIYARENFVYVGGIVGGLSSDGLAIMHCRTNGALEACGTKASLFNDHYTRVGGIVGGGFDYKMEINDCLVYCATPFSAHGADGGNAVGAIIGKSQNNINEKTIKDNAYLTGTAKTAAGAGTVGYTKEFAESEIHNNRFSSVFSGFKFCEFKNITDLLDSDYKNCWIYSSDSFPVLWFERK